MLIGGGGGARAGSGGGGGLGGARGGGGGGLGGSEVTQDTNNFSHAEGVGVAKSFHEKFTVFGGGGQFFFLAQGAIHK